MLHADACACTAVFSAHQRQEALRGTCKIVRTKGADDASRCFCTRAGTGAQQRDAYVWVCVHSGLRQPCRDENAAPRPEKNVRTGVPTPHSTSSMSRDMIPDATGARSHGGVVHEASRRAGADSPLGDVGPCDEESLRRRGEGYGTCGHVAAGFKIIDQDCGLRRASIAIHCARSDPLKVATQGFG